MSYMKSTTYTNWVYDNEMDEYISPSGRLALYPGAPFHGTLPQKEFALIKEAVNETVYEKTPSNEETGDLVSHKELSVQVVSTIRFGDVTVNFIRVS